MTVSAPVRFKPGAAGLERDQEHVGAALLERVDRLLAIRRGAGQRDVADAAREQRLGDQAEHARELREDQDAAAVGELLVTISSSTSSFALPATSRAASTATRRGSQQTWRSLSSASRIAIVEPASPRWRMCWRTSACAATRMLS